MLSDHTIGLLGLIIGIVGLPIGIYGIYLALQSDRKLKTAQQAKDRIERKFNQYLGAQEFKGLAVDGLAIIQAVRKGDWPAVAMKAGLVNLDLPQARGARSRLLTSLESDKLDAAVAAMRRLNVSLPLADQPPSNEQIQTMILQCQELVDLAGDLAGRLGVESMSEIEDER